MTSDDLPLPPYSTCPQCGTALLPSAVQACPQCGRYWGAQKLQRAVSVLDGIAAGVLALMALAASVPSFWLLADSISRLAFSEEVLIALAMQSWIWGPPALALAFARRHNVLHDRHPAEGLLKVYRRVPLITLLVPLGVVLLVGVVCSLSGLQADGDS